MAPFKEQLSPQLVARLADELAAAWPAFPRERFTAAAGDGLESLELKARATQIAAALEAALPEDFAEVTAVFDAALRSPTFRGWMLWPCTDAVAAAGAEHPAEALRLLGRLSPRFTSESAVRPLIDRHPEVAFAELHRFAGDRDEHVRRLASEGTRPRLPWSSRLRALQADPTPSIALLDRLRDDDSEYVRRSVANHLGDIAKDHPELAVATARRWLDEGGAHTAWVVRHGLRDLVKRGDAGALALLGFDAGADVELVALDVAPGRIAIGESAELSAVLRAGGGRPVPAMVDYVVLYVGARGGMRRKVFKLAQHVLQPGRPHRLVRRHAFREVSIRRLYPGTHRIELQVNGQVLGGVELELTAPATIRP